MTEEPKPYGVDLIAEGKASNQLVDKTSFLTPEELEICKRTSIAYGKPNDLLVQIACVACKFVVQGKMDASTNEQMVRTVVTHKFAGLAHQKHCPHWYQYLQQTSQGEK